MITDGFYLRESEDEGLVSMATGMSGTEKTAMALLAALSWWVPVLYVIGRVWP